MIRQKQPQTPEYDCLNTDLVNSFPPSTEGYDINSMMYVYDSVTKELVSIFELLDISGALTWYKI